MHALTIRLLAANAGDHVVLQEAAGHEMASCAFSSNGRVVARFADRSVRVYRTDNGERVGVLKGHKKAVRCAAREQGGAGCPG